MARWSRLLLAILSAQASRGRAKRIQHSAASDGGTHLTAVDAGTDVHSNITAVSDKLQKSDEARHSSRGAAASTRGHLAQASNTGLHSNIVAASDKLQKSDEARHSSSGAAASTRGHLAQASNRLSDAASFVGPFFLGCAVMLLCFVVAFCCFHVGAAESTGRSRPLARPTFGEADLVRETPSHAVGQARSQSKHREVPNAKAVGLWKKLEGHARHSHAAGPASCGTEAERTHGEVPKANAGLFDVVRMLTAHATESPVLGRSNEEMENDPYFIPLYESLRQVSDRMRGAVTQFPSSTMGAVVRGAKSRYIIVEPSSDSDPATRWRNAQINFFVTASDFTSGADPYNSVCVCDIVSVKWYDLSGSDSQIVLTTYQRVFFLRRDTQSGTEQLHMDLCQLSELAKQLLNDE